MPQGNRATRCREEGSGWWRRGAGTYRQPLCSEARLGSVTGPSGPLVVRQLQAISALLERRLLGNFKQPEAAVAAGTLFSNLFAMARAIRAPWSVSVGFWGGCQLSLFWGGGVGGS